MKNLLNYQDREDILARLQKLGTTNQPRWGKLSVNQVVTHLTDPFRVAIHEKSGTPQNTMFFNTWLGKAMYSFVPWPKGAPTDPSFLPGTGMTEPTEFERDKQILLLTIHRFVNYEEKTADSPVFGRMDKRAWGRLMWRHLDHHLRQFGA